MTYFPAWQYQVCGEIRVKYDSLGGPNSFLLLPTSSNITNGDGVGQRVTFELTELGHEFQQVADGFCG